MTLLEIKFDYTQLDVATTSFLQLKESSMREIVGKAYTELGRELKEAQDELSNHGYGCFEEWYTSLGYKTRTVYNMINRYGLILQNLQEQDLLESLPVSLSYEISKGSVDPELKQAVLDGEITTHKQYKELEQKLKQAEAARQLSIKQHSEQQGKLLEQIDALKKSKTSDSPESLKRIKDLERQLLSNSNMLKKAEQELSAYRLRDTSEFDEEAARKQREKLQHEADIKTIDLRVAFKRFIENAAISSILYGAIASASTAEKKHLTEMVEMAEKVIRDTKLALSGRKEIE